MIIPPIKCQGIKTKLVNWIYNKVPKSYNVWHEPFMGSGVVGFNIKPKQAIFSDTNPHIIKFYNDIKNKNISSDIVREFLYQEGKKLSLNGYDYYKEVRARFNNNPNSLDFLFLNRACFNGMIRFNKNGKFNVPFCKKNNRFSKAYITKIVNQVKAVEDLILTNDYNFICCDFEQTIHLANTNDIIYCDPPYIDRYADYYNGWSEEDERRLFELLNNTSAKFILSTWHHNKYRENKYIKKYWSNFKIDTTNHFYFLGGQEINRSEILEASVKNF